MMRRKSRYKSKFATYIEGENRRIPFWCDEVSIEADIQDLGGQPIANEGARYITDSDIAFKKRKFIQIDSDEPRRILGVLKRPQEQEVGEQITTSMRTVAKSKGRRRVMRYDVIIRTT